jgi:hypothetical protein
MIVVTMKLHRYAAELMRVYKKFYGKRENAIS